VTDSAGNRKNRSNRRSPVRQFIVKDAIAICIGKVRGQLERQLFPVAFLPVKENAHVRQVAGERRRRWFSSEDFDLIVWLNDDHTFAGFELCYDKMHNEHSIIWRPGRGFEHTAVDDGEQRPGKYKASPILVADGTFDAMRVYSAFSSESHSLPKDIAEYVMQALEKYPDHGAKVER